MSEVQKTYERMGLSAREAYRRTALNRIAAALAEIELLGRIAFDNDDDRASSEIVRAQDALGEYRERLEKGVF